MLTRFYFDLQNGSSSLRDHEGVEARDLDEAINEARSVIAEMRAFALKSAGFQHAELDALFAAGVAGILTVSLSP